AIGPPPPRLRREIFAHLDRIARRPSIELAWIDLAARLFSPPAPRPPAASGAPAPLPAPTTS
ncbi:MAG: hypothetical protein R3B70_39080, partial [Polyangiaceae bacterium]